MNYGFHVKNGLFFQKDAEGNVIIRKVSSGRVMFKATIEPNSWASVVASVCKRGEDGITFQQALGFHMENGGIGVAVRPL